MTFFPEEFYVATSDQEREPYRIEARDGSGQLVCFARDLFSARVEAPVNQAPTLRVTCARDNAFLDAIAGRNQIWVWKRKAEKPSWRFLSSTVVESSEGDGAEAVCYGLLWQLSRELALAYSVTDRKISDILGDWFALQLAARALTIGVIDSAIGDLTRTVKIEDSDNILHAIGALAETVEAETFYWVDSDGVFHWRVAETAVENHITTRREMKGIQRTTDNGAVITRLYAFGKNESGERVRLSGAVGQTEDYLDSTESAWGYYAQIIVAAHGVSVDPALSFAGVGPFALKISETLNDGLRDHAASDGSDIRFFDSDGVYLPHELDAYDPATGAITAWVQLQELSATVDTVIYMRYGGGADGAGSVDHAPAGKSAEWVATYDANALAGFYTMGPCVTGFGLVPGVITYDNVSDAEVLLDLAQAQIDLVSVPYVAYEINLLDLDAYRLFPDRVFTLGRYQHIVDAGMSADVTQAIIRLDRNLLDPIDVTVTIGELARGVNPAGTIDENPVEEVTEEADEIQEAIGSFELMDEGGTIDADQVVIAATPAEIDGYPFETPTKLNDWEYKPGDVPSGLIDGEYVHGGSQVPLFVTPEQAAFGIKDYAEGPFDIVLVVTALTDGVTVTEGTHAGDTTVFSLVDFTTLALDKDDTANVTVRFNPASNDGSTYACALKFTVNQNVSALTILAVGGTQAASEGVTYNLVANDGD